MAYVQGKSLSEYMEQRNVHRGIKCWVCSLPNDLRCQIERGWYDKKVPMAAILEWLVDVMGEKDATRGKLVGHLTRHDRVKVEG